MLAIFRRFARTAACLCLAGSLSAQGDTLRILFAGDIMGHEPQIRSAEIVPNKEYNYSPCFQHIRPLISAADLAIGNLELTLPGRLPYTGYPMFRSPNALAVALKEAGFDVLATANNHSNDGRGSGLAATVRTVRDLGFLQTGTFENQQDRAANYPLVIHQNGFKIALLNYTYGTNGVPTDPPGLVNLIDTIQIKKDLAEAITRQPDFIIAFMHWGLEYQLQENKEQQQLARLLIAHGADMVIGAHPHVAQPIKWESARNAQNEERKGLVVYSLGNFISNQQKPHTDGGLLFQFELVKNPGESKAQLGNYGYLPVYRYVHKPAAGKPVYYAIPIARFEAEPDLFPDMGAAARAAMKAYAQGVRERLKDCPEWR